MNTYQELTSSVNKHEYFFHLVDKLSKLPCLIYPIANEKGFGCLAIYLSLNLELIQDIKLFESVQQFEPSVLEFDKADFSYRLNDIGYSSATEIPTYFFDKLYRYKGDAENYLYPICKLDDYFLVYNYSSANNYIRACKLTDFKNLELIDFDNPILIDSLEKLIYDQLSKLGRSTIDIISVINQYRFVKNNP